MDFPPAPEKGSWLPTGSDPAGDAARPRVRLPQSTGYFAWHILDLDHIEVGLVEVREEVDGELLRLQMLGMSSARYHAYEAEDGRLLVLYHRNDPDRLPACDEFGLPFVDGYRRIELDWVLGRDEVH